MEHAIGTRITLEVVEDTKGIECDGCFFRRHEYNCPPCDWMHRSDHKDIIYKEIKED